MSGLSDGQIEEAASSLRRVYPGLESDSWSDPGHVTLIFDAILRGPLENVARAILRRLRGLPGFAVRTDEDGLVLEGPVIRVGFIDLDVETDWYSDTGPDYSRAEVIRLDEGEGEGEEEPCPDPC